MKCEWCGVERDVPAVGPHECEPRKIQRRALQDAAAAAVGICVCEHCTRIRERIEGAQRVSWEWAYGKDAVRPD